MKNVSKGLLLIFLIVFGGFTIGQPATIINSGTCIQIANGTTLDISNGNLVVSSGSTSDASILGDGNIAFSGGGQAEVQRYLSNGKWHFISSPVSNAIAGMFMDDYLQYYSEADYYYYDIIPPSTALNVMQGYGLWTIDAEASTEVFEGETNSGNFSFSFTQTDFPDNSKEGWNLIGNPYPSAIDWDQVNIPVQLNGAFWVFDPTIGSTGDFLYYINGGGGANTTSQYISSGQGFFIRATGGNGILQFSNNIRVHSSQDFYKKDENQQMLVIKAKSNNIESQTTIRFNPGASSGIDRLYDVNKLITNSVDVPVLYSQCENQNMAINTLPSIAEHQIIPLYFTCGKNGNYELNIEGISSFDENIPLYIEDVELEYIQNLRTNNKYLFEHEEKTIRRFNLYFKHINEIDDNQNQTILTYFTDDFLVIDLLNNFQQHETFHLSVFDISGQKVLYHQLTNKFTRIPFINASGIYVLKVKNSNNVYSNKLIKK